MVLKIHNVGKWSTLKAGEVLELNGEGQRKVRLHVNCPSPARFDVIEGDVGTFLAVVQGLEVIEFTAREGVYILVTSDDDISYFTNDGDQIAVDRPNAVSFTKIAERRTRNPELERIMFKMEQNQMRRLAALQAEIEAMRAAHPPHDPETGEVDEVDPGAAGTDPGASSGDEAGDPEPASAGQGGSVKPAT